MSKKTASYDDWLIETLKDPDNAAAYLNEHLADDGEDADEVFLVALRNVAIAKGVSKVAEAAELGRESLYKSLSPQGNPKLSTLIAVLKAIGLHLSVSVMSEQIRERKSA